MEGQRVGGSDVILGAALNFSEVRHSSGCALYADDTALRRLHIHAAFRRTLSVRTSQDGIVYGKMPAFSVGPCSTTTSIGNIPSM